MFGAKISRRRRRQGRVVQPAVTMLTNCACAVALICAAAALSRAQAPPSSTQTQPPAIAPPSSPPTHEVTDEMGRTIQVPQNLRRIVSLSPNLTETLYALGLQDLLVGDTDYCDFPAAAQHKPRVGGVINPSIEAVVALQPDLVLVTKLSNRPETVDALAQLGIPSYATDPHTIQEIISSIRRLADLMGASDAGSALAKELQRRLADTQRRVAQLPRSRVLFTVWTQPLISIGKDTFIADALHYAGAESIVDVAQSWPQVNLEEVARLQPDFLVFAGTHAEIMPLKIASLSELPGWRLLDAVRSHRYVHTDDSIDRPAPRLISAIEDLARQFHPEAFSDKPAAAPDHQDKDSGAGPPSPPPAPNPNTLLGASRHLAAQNLQRAEDLACAR